MEEIKKDKVNEQGEKGGRRRSGRPRQRREREQSEFDVRNLEVSRVARVTSGGKRMRFRVLVVIGDRNGRVGYGLAKGADVSLAVNKATAAAKKNLIHVKITTGTIPHAITAKYKAAMVLLKPAPDGTGIIAGGAVRPVLELVGIKNVVSKSLGSSNKANNVKVTFKALRQLINKKS
ncbi:MAG: 30S ribosomal protein S5 [bacterium]